MKKFLDEFKYNPIPPLLECGNKAILLFVKRDFLNRTVCVQDLWQLPEA
jgi:hypothetical protein